MKIFIWNKLVPAVFAFMFTLPINAAEKFITLASTTSTQASGFFDYYLPFFMSKTGIEVRVVAVGTGQALKLGESGDADVLLVHDTIGEQAFIRKGYGVDRREVMYNDFIIVGPKDDPAGINELNDAVTALKKIADSNALFISRGDDSGTHRKELRLWKEVSINPEVSGQTWYKQAGAGMGAVLNMATGMNAYTISDRATWIRFANRSNLAIQVEGDPPLFNQYALMLVNPERNTHVKQQEATAFINWMTAKEGQKLIAEFKLGGKVLFHPNAR
jgi:tungstate transport system substrate-binding protein